MPRNLIDLDDLHKMFTDAGIEHRYTPGDIVITVNRGAHVWTVSEDSILYWGNGINVRRSRFRDIFRTDDAYDYIMDAYSKVQ